MNLGTLGDALSWRWRLAGRERFLRRQFRNGRELFDSYISKSKCQIAVRRDGTAIRHPDRAGLAQTILEVWHDKVYTNKFYIPRKFDIIIDAGANVGLFSLWVARACPGCRILAFEPFAENYRFLGANLAEARAARVEAFPVGLSGVNGLAYMRGEAERSLDHRLEISRDATPGNPEVRTISFAEVVHMAGGGIALFKCDIEGSEHDMFDQATPRDLGAVSRYAIEYHDNIRPGTSELLRRRLSATHDIVIRPDGDHGYGMLYATIKPPA